MARKKKPSDEPPAAERHPFLARWCRAHGWVEVGYEEMDELFARAFHGGGMAWGGKGPYATLDDALAALEAGVRSYMEENGWE